MTFGLFDLLDEVPDHLQNKFDVLHVRLLLGAGPAVDKSVFIDCFSKMLKPGGWLQWDELAWPAVRIVHPPMLRQIQETRLELRLNHTQL